MKSQAMKGVPRPRRCLDGDDVRMFQASGFGLPNEAIQPVAIGGQLGRQDLQRHAAVQAGILGEIHLSIPPLPSTAKSRNALAERPCPRYFLVTPGFGLVPPTDCRSRLRGAGNYPAEVADVGARRLGVCRVEHARAGWQWRARAARHERVGCRVARELAGQASRFQRDNLVRRDLNQPDGRSFAQWSSTYLPSSAPLASRDASVSSSRMDGSRRTTAADTAQSTSASGPDTGTLSSLTERRVFWPRHRQRHGLHGGEIGSQDGDDGIVAGKDRTRHCLARRERVHAYMDALTLHAVE